MNNLSLRQYLIGQALAGVAGGVPNASQGPGGAERVAKAAIAYADAVMEELKKEKSAAVATKD